MLVVTGYAENAAVANGHLDPGKEVITKPLGIVALSGKVREMLDRGTIEVPIPAKRRRSLAQR